MLVTWWRWKLPIAWGVRWCISWWLTGEVGENHAGRIIMQRPGHSAAESITEPYVGYLVALETAYRVDPVVHELVRVGENHAGGMIAER